MKVRKKFGWSFQCLLVLLLCLSSLGPTRGFFAQDMPQIRLHYAVFDPLMGEPSIPLSQRSVTSRVDPVADRIHTIRPARNAKKVSIQETTAGLYG